MEGTFSRTSANAQQEVTIMLLGSIGAGKSASGNTILNRARNPFEEDFSPEAVTRICQSEQTEVDGQTITVIDTAGLCDSSVKIRDAHSQIEKMLTFHSVDVFLLVIKLGENFTKIDNKVVKWIRENFGGKALKHTIVLFTHGDLLHGTVERYLTKCGILRAVVSGSGGFHVFNNRKEDRFQATELLKEVNKLRRKNDYQKYSIGDYKKTQEDLLRVRCSVGVSLGVWVGFTIGSLAGILIGGIAEMIAFIGEVPSTAENLAVIGAFGGAVMLGAAGGAGMYLLSKYYNLMMTMYSP